MPLYTSACDSLQDVRKVLHYSASLSTIELNSTKTNERNTYCSLILSAVRRSVPATMLYHQASCLCLNKIMQSSICVSNSENQQFRKSANQQISKSANQQISNCSS